MRILGIIPSRFASSRFPGKPLVNIGGKTMIRRVYEQCKKSQKLDDVIVATDNRRIYDEVLSFNGKAMMTQESHRNGTERCAEVLSHLEDYDYAINIQGDEPFIWPEQIDEVAGLLDGRAELATLVKEIEYASVLDEPTEIKVVINRQHQAIYFSRSCIPHLRNLPKDQWLHHHTFYKHIGIYGYRRDILFEITQLPMGILEAAESLEQLRWIENGYKIITGTTAYDSTMIDTPEDLKKVLKELNL